MVLFEEVEARSIGHIRIKAGVTRILAIRSPVSHFRWEIQGTRCRPWFHCPEIDNPFGCYLRAVPKIDSKDPYEKLLAYGTTVKSEAQVKGKMPMAVQHLLRFFWKRKRADAAKVGVYGIQICLQRCFLLQN